MRQGEFILLLLLAASIAAFASCIWVLGRHWTLKYREQQVDEASESLKAIFLSVPPLVLLAINLATVVLFYVAFSWYFGTWVFGVVGGALGFLVPSRVIRRLRERWLNTIDEQFPQALTVLANSLRAGLGISQAVALVTDESLPPLRYELTRVRREEQMGVSASDALGHLAERVPTEDMRLFTSAVRLTLQTGGSLADVLSTLAATIRERRRLRGKVSALTAQGRMQAWVVAVMPFAVFLMMSAVEPEMMFRMFGIMLGPISLGRIVLAVVVGLEALAFLWVRKIMAVEV